MTPEDLHNVIRLRFKTLIEDLEAVPTQYDNAPFTKPKDAIWVRWSVRPGERRQASTGAATNRYRRVGVAIAQIFEPVERGDAGALSLAGKIESAFRSVTDSGVRFRTPSTTAMGRDGEYWQVNVTCPWYVDDVA